MNTTINALQDFSLGYEYADDSALRKQLGRYKTVKRVMKQRHTLQYITICLRRAAAAKRTAR
jgi:hypothetical protein